MTLSYYYDGVIFTVIYFTVELLIDSIYKENTMLRTYHNKLVRDKIPDIIRLQGNHPECHIANDRTEYCQALREKILEEAIELKKCMGLAHFKRLTFIKNWWANPGLEFENDESSMRQTRNQGPSRVLLLF